MQHFAYKIYKNIVCGLVLQETVLTSIRPTDEVTVTLVIKLVKVLPPESCHQLYNIIFRR